MVEVLAAHSKLQALLDWLPQNKPSLAIGMEAEAWHSNPSLSQNNHQTGSETVVRQVLWSN
jgi:hypothetical protein